jgi:hypothetical protein
VGGDELGQHDQAEAVQPGTQRRRTVGGDATGRLVDAKKRRMPFIAANGQLVLLPCALVLDRWAGAGSFDVRFYAVQALELAAGAANLTLMSPNLRDGLRLAGRLRRPGATGMAARAPRGSRGPDDRRRGG